MIVALLAIVSRAFAEDKLQVKDFKVGSGCTAKMEIVLTNPDAKYTAFETDIYLPEGLQLVKQDDEYKVETSRTAESHSASISQKTGYYKLVLSSTKNEELSGIEGTVVTLIVKANPNITVGNRTGYLKKIKLARNDNTGVIIGEEAFNITVVEPSTVTAKSYERVYGEANPLFEYEVAGGALDGTPEITCEATEKSPVGTYDIIVKGGMETDNSVTYVKGTLTITKAPLKIMAGTYTKKRGKENPEFTLTYEGFKNEETKDALTKQPIITTTATKESAVGEYEVKVSGAAAQNYEISYTNGVLIIEMLLGDANVDGDVTEADVKAVVKHIMGQTPTGFDKEAADVNGDKVVNVADIVEIVKMKK